MDQFLYQLKSDASAVENRLDELLGTNTGPDEIYRPHRLICAMRHATLNGGKRLRPFLVMQTGRLLGADPENLLQVATALECIHCYSLIHDDLPAMDDDDLRRGQPTVHKAYDEATAILSGDALLTYAFQLLGDPLTHSSADIRIQLISRLAAAAGMGGMVGGQMLDLQPENDPPDADNIATMQAMKTGALIKYACIAGGICGRATNRQLSALEEYGDSIGQAFQLKDDILDVTATSAQIGKTAAKDHAQGKQTQVSTMGIDKTRAIADELVARAANALALFEDKTRYEDNIRLLVDAAHFTVQRNK